MNKLIGMTDFVLERDKREEVCREDFIKCRNYANFLKQPLELRQFVPCKLINGVWVILEEPKKYKNWTNYDYSGTDIGFDDEKLCREYQQAKEKCLFEGFRADGKYLWLNNLLFMISDDFNESFKKYGNVENLLNNYLTKDLELTKTAIKQLSL